jgi:hypothetical protein
MAGVKPTGAAKARHFSKIMAVHVQAPEGRGSGAQRVSRAAYSHQPQPKKFSGSAE